MRFEEGNSSSSLIANLQQLSLINEYYSAELRFQLRSYQDLFEDLKCVCMVNGK